MRYCIARKFGGIYIWQNSLQASGSLHMVRLKCEDQSRSHGRVSTRELCSRPSHTQEYVDSVVGGSTFCGFVASRLMLRLGLAFAFSRSFWVRVDDSHVIFLRNVEKNLCKAILSLHIQTSLRVRSTVK